MAPNYISVALQKLGSLFYANIIVDHLDIAQKSKKYIEFIICYTKIQDFDNGY